MIIDKIIEREKEIKEDIIKNFNELSSTDLMQLSQIAKEIVDKRMEKCAKDGMFGDYAEDLIMKNKTMKERILRTLEDNLLINREFLEEERIKDLEEQIKAVKEYEKNPLKRYLKRLLKELLKD